jgi:hypothetical protein
MHQPLARLMLMNKLVLGYLLAGCCANVAWAQMPASEELPAVAGTQSNSATTTLQDVATIVRPTATPPATVEPTPANDIDAVINNVVNNTTPDTAATDATATTNDDTATLGAAPAAELPVEEEPAQELADDPMQPQKFAVLGALDKVTGRTATLNVPVDKVVAVGPLFLQVKACQKASAFANQPENAAFVQVWQSDDAGQSKATSWVFSGWMFASSPSLSAMDHPVYDVWVIDCKNAVKQAAKAAIAKDKPSDTKPSKKPANDLSGKD